MRTILAAMMALTLGMGGAQLRAGDTPVVVELFTSQGCSSCPSADEMLAHLGAKENVIALALHVDYWDYIGWKDKFAHSAFTKRQKGYARAFGNRSIYTPQMVVNGTADVVGNRPLEVADLVQAQAERGLPVSLDLTRSGGALSVAAPANGGLPDADVFVLRYIPSQTVDIPRGENAGKSITYTHIVTEWHDIGDWNGLDDLSLSVPISGDQPIVVLVQAKNHGPIFAAARLR
ncbi:DUF1223 domain-containing protein [Marivita sp. GX14005]|uniref:DUF1223 domain-containing protein n=1 Tax=Marivita sp. GX14005 TaxID=2942276 RepID=UPI0020193308|nr:DUF1223 domain-containing protein [Marivita sp. GX14005]MCL3882795.1 DUF1223 domain-containing protein [Marivita sp. GX14005]